MAKTYKIADLHEKPTLDQNSPCPLLSPIEGIEGVKTSLFFYWICIFLVIVQYFSVTQTTNNVFEIINELPLVHPLTSAGG